METAISTLSILPYGKAEVAGFSRMLKDELLSGNCDPLKVLIQMKFAEKVFADVLKDDEIDALMVRELEKYGKEKAVEINGVKLSMQETGVKYAYEDSGDPVWNDLNKEMEILKEKIKERETFLKNIPHDAGIADTVTGVFITRPPKTSKTKVVVRV